MNEVSGFVVPPDDPAAAAARLLRLLRDRATARAMGNAGEALVASRFTTDVMVSELSELYCRLAEELHH